MNFFRPFVPLLKGWGLAFLGFGFVTTLMSVQFLITTHAPIEYAVRSSVRDWLPWIILTPLLFRLAARFPIGLQKRGTRVAIHLASGIVVLLLCHWWEGIADPGFRPAGPGGPGLDHRGPPPGGPPWLKLPPPDHGAPAHDAGPRRGLDLIRLGSFQLPLYLMIMSAAHATLFYRRDRARAASLARARLDVLTTQLQPHFLFNTLNTIAELVHEDPNRADEIITALSEMLRLTLDANATDLVPLQREVEFIERYVAIMQARFGERLQFDCDLPAAAGAGLVPPFLLQPLVENAIRHGIEPKLDGGRVTIEGVVSDGTLRISVRNNGVGLPEGRPQREGLGLTNIRERLQQTFGEDATVTLKNGSGVEVTITLPYRTA